MRARFVLTFVSFLGSVAVLISGCGLPGAPQAPSLHIPKPIQDLRAARKGNDVVLSWTAPTQSTDGTLVRRPGKMLILRAIASQGRYVNIAEETLQPALGDGSHQRTTITDSLASLLRSSSPTDFVIYRVTAVGERNRTAGPGNLVQVSAAPVMNPPAKVDLRLAAKGVEVSFVPESSPPMPGIGFSYKVQRRLEGSNGEPAIVAHVPAGTSLVTIMDPRIEWEATYEYWVTPITHWQLGGRNGDVEGEDSPREKILAHDTFPPAVPGGLQAVYSGDPQSPAVDLTWTPDSDEDLAGYNVFRREGAGEFVQINKGLVKTPAFHDTQVKAGSTLTYAVSAVDARGNESAKSGETSERVPKE